MRLDIYFDGTGVSLNGSNERIYGRSVVGHAFVQNKAEDVFFDPSDYSNLLSNSNTALINLNIANSTSLARFQGTRFTKGATSFNPAETITQAISAKHTYPDTNQRYGPKFTVVVGNIAYNLHYSQQST
ncbi:hypothetical protein AVI50_03790 [Piscirickettsia salmonis]|nr:hypothetical protein AVI50_03790 [Piscirickettsia salmonis]